ncbi:MAG: ComEC family competence protein, partial [Flavobacteriales bacterium]|nr:ComEC family competence protein [Flavobacteriales bacterium]
MRIWNAFPMLRLVLPFIGGVIFAAFILEVFAFGRSHFLIAFLSVSVLLVFLFLIGGKTRKPHFFGLLLFPCLFLLGGLLTVSVSDHLYPSHIKAQLAAQGASTYMVKIVDQPQEKAKSVKIVAELVDSELRENGKVLFYFSKDSLSQQLEYGNILVLNSKLNRVQGMGNPNEFNYARYLRFHNILFRGYVKNDGWQLLSEGEPSLKRWFLRIRFMLVEKLKAARLGKNELSVASALILGYRADHDKELMSAYAGAGATHVLAVSGLHVGIVYVILNGLLKFMDRSKRGRILKTILLIILLFGYAGLTGLSASVFRAATMFSFVAVGKAFNRDTNIFNTLAASAFCLILYEPMIVMQVGFQLSYLAVMGIVLIQPLLFNLYTCKNQFMDWAWSITCVSVAAQLATFPLGLLYFHQFPNLFLLSNLLVIPAAAVILYLGFSLFLFSFWEPTLLFFGFLLDFIIGLLNKVVSWIENIPYSVLSGIDISIFESLLIYGTIAGMLYVIIQKEFVGLRIAIVLTLALVSFQIVEVYQQKNQEFITIYNVKNETAMALVKGTEVTFISSNEFYRNEQAMLFHVRHHWWNKGIESEIFIELTDSILNRKMNWNGVEFAIMDLVQKGASDSLVADTTTLAYMLVRKVAWDNCEQISQIQSEQVYVSNSVGPKTVRRLKM